MTLPTHVILALGLSVADNMTLTRLQPLGPAFSVLPSRQLAAATRWIDRLGIRCASARQTVGELSGGNQQKVAVARLLYHGVDVLVLDEPTRGIDVASKAQIYALIDELVCGRDAKAVLLVSSSAAAIRTRRWARGWIWPGRWRGWRRSRNQAKVSAGRSPSHVWGEMAM